MNSDYILKGRSQLALHKPDWAQSAPSVSARAATATTPSDSDFAAAVQKHETAKAAHAPAKSASRYAKAEAITDQLNKAPSRSQTQAAQEPTQEPTEQPSSEISQDGSLYPERSKAKATQMNAFNHSGSSKKTVGPDVDNVDYTFEDFIDTINPLQQIPIVNLIYRNLTGDRISGASQVMGSALYWGPMGVVTGAIDAIFEQEKGGDLGETMVASLLGTDTPNAKNLPSNKKITAPETMLADASDDMQSTATVMASQTPSVSAPNAPSAHRLATKQAPAKQPFGGVMGNDSPSQIANEEAAPQRNSTVTEAGVAEKDAVDEEGARLMAAAQPAKPTAPHAPMEADGHKLYSLAGVPRHPSVSSHMPLRDMPDVRLKTYGKEIAKSTPAGDLKDGAGLLGLQKPAAALAAAPNDNMDIPATVLPDPGFSAPLAMPAANSNMQTPSGNPLPAQLIQDMMLMNMQKYQDMKNGTSRGSSVDING